MMFYVFFGGLQGSWKIAKPFIGIDCAKINRLWGPGKSQSSCYRIFVAVELHWNILEENGSYKTTIEYTGFFGQYTKKVVPKKLPKCMRFIAKPEFGK